MEKMFRPLRADEIECRIGSIKETGLSLLLYKDARCDMNILDETVGPFGWKRKHIRDNANCIVSIYDERKGEWIDKEDTGTESNTEAEKGLASDSFKRACFNWGIGRELYTAPFIWISSDNCKIEKRQFNGKERLICNDKFNVAEIEYGDKGEISKLVITNVNKGVDVFIYPRNSRLTSTGGVNTSTKKETQQKATEAPDGYFYCEHCGEVIAGVKQNGQSRSPTEVAERALKKYGQQLCWSCQKNREKQAD